MALSSQSSRSGSRRSYMTSRRRRNRGRWILLLIMLAAVIGGGWWWFQEDDAGNLTADAPTTREPDTGTIDMAPRRTPARPSLDPVTGDRDAALGTRGTRSSGANTTTARDIDGTPSSKPLVASPRVPLPDPKPTISIPKKPTRVATDSKPVTGSPTPAPTDSKLSTAMASRSRATMRLNESIKLESSDPIAAREALGEAWIGGLSDDDRQRAADLSRRLAKRTLLAGARIPGSPWTRAYTIRPNDTLGGILNGQKIATSQSFIARINGLDDPNAIRANQTLLLPTGRFHGVVDLDSRDLAVFQELESGRRDLLLVIPIALGPDLEAGLDPDRDRVTGTYRVRPRGMRRNPSWTDPASGIRWSRGDIQNPVGEHWISLELLGGADDDTRPPVALHGTGSKHPIDDERHPGLVAMDPADIELLYLMLDTGDSVVDVRR
ncbi:MAG: LysM peptidoglycan-binding domain-containing protein [Phycisphaera sp.]|nr:LysM peptidoglycan-binding domain-containing protein [Phycisphaera sp.]